MKINLNYTIRAWLLASISSCILLGCQPDSAYDPPEMECTGFGLQPISLAELKASYAGETLQISDSAQWKAVVVSSDATSNIFGEIYLQDPSDPSQGALVFYTDLLETHAKVPLGSSVTVNLKGLYFGASSGSYELGASFSSFGNLGVGRLPARLFEQHIRVDCDARKDLSPLARSISELSDNLLNMYLEIQEVEFIPEETGLAFADSGQEARRTLTDCFGNLLNVKNSGYSDFHAQTLPEGHGSVRGLLNKYRNRYELIVMSPADFMFQDPVCLAREPGVGSDSILISEIADPDNLPQGRFLELFNASEVAVDLAGWELLRYTNANIEPGSSVSLEGLKIGAGQALTLSAYPEEFESIYGFPPDKIVSANGPADSNGDDSMVLVDPFGNVKDVFGNPGIDGSGTSHEFEDGKAERRPEVRISRALFDPSQWWIYNDSGGQNTIKEPRNAPEDFSPGMHPGDEGP